MTSARNPGGGAEAGWGVARGEAGAGCGLSVTLMGTRAGLHVLVTKHSPLPATRVFLKNPRRGGPTAPILQMRKLRPREARGSHGSGSSRAGSWRQRSWRGWGGGGAATHTGRCCWWPEAGPLLRLGPHTRRRPPTPAALQTLLSETKPSSCLHPREDAFAAHRSVGRCPECPLPKPPGTVSPERGEAEKTLSWSRPFTSAP